MDVFACAGGCANFIKSHESMENQAAETAKVRPYNNRVLSGATKYQVRDVFEFRYQL